MSQEDKRCQRCPDRLQPLCGDPANPDCCEGEFGENRSGTMPGILMVSSWFLLVGLVAGLFVGRWIFPLCG